ncbi:O-acetyl-ADP-ribose deacetylase [Hymenobacter sp. IS2118]|uniref:O-acetyl-ADP-ribose deacetylase n=1 Tax=Hymenobacter sp. IS2118 TaxID=1505605 RepID=UPI0009075CE0|nr:O-acetyl-ADP-ribose deacetylase [Hymenobacter sp. IS2118]
MDSSLANRIEITQGDITKQKVDAIVNAANSSLLGGGGVDGAIHRAGGSAILDECRAIRARQGGCKTGEAVITTGGRLPATHVIHTVGPVWNGGQKGESALLAACYRNSLRLATGHQLASVAFPGISTGIYGYPKQEAAAIAVREVRQWLAAHDFPRTVVFVAFDEENRRLYEQALTLPALFIWPRVGLARPAPCVG